MSDIHFNKPMRKLLERLDNERSGVFLRRYENGLAAILRDNGIIDISPKPANFAACPGPIGDFYAHLTSKGRKWIDENREKFKGKKDKNGLL